ncbi:sensor histidine kinase [Dyadobacter subterraneus]|uniref:Histidine kinase n=1 Tax=Dyadobacter subterraneus TaxID=2773304 RepID=A0ABR9WA78_9BACT|nr:histidine kinase [Dyadobacter subterraneus]MBE9462355.1 histidine kinase [Dyadobacter subterraneus]
MTKPKNQYLYHILGCLAFLLLPLTLSPRPPEEVGYFLSKPTQRDFVVNLLMLVFFYINYYILIPRVYFREKYLVYSLFLAVGFGLILFFPSFVTGNFSWQDHPGRMGGFNPHNGHFIPSRPVGSIFFEEVKHHIYLFAVVALFSILLQVNSRLLQAEKERLAAELAHLKAQIHPHFLFNTLNSIYALTIKKDDKAPDSIVKLSEFMRYLLKDANENEVFLDKEIGYITNYIDLQISRLRDSVNLNFEVNGTAKNQKIAPLLLFSFIENAFKHGVNPDEDSKIDIRIDIKNESVYLLVINKKVTIINKEYSTNIGLANTRERLHLFYANKHKLRIDNNTEFFKVELEIELI